jgi:TonB family protein
MPTPRAFALLCFATTTLFCLSLLAGGATATTRAQEPPPPPASVETLRGIQLYRQGQNAQAIEVLEKVIKRGGDDDANAWYYLGLAYKRDGRERAAGIAFENMVSLRPMFADGWAKLAFALILANDYERAAHRATRALELGDKSAESHYVIGEASLRKHDDAQALAEADKALKIKPDLLPALLVKAMAHQNLKQYEKAAESFAQMLALSSDNVDAELWRAQMEHLRKSIPNKEEDRQQTIQPQVFPPRDVMTKARVLSKPEPSYTTEARKAGVEGTVILRAVFVSDGSVRIVSVKQWLPYGLTTRAVKAAKKIQFTPAVIDGRQVSQYIQIEYNFNLY